jgi:hypothetical protein
MAKQSSTAQLKQLEKAQEQKNIRDFFDKFKRIQQKARLKGEFPDENTLSRLDTYKETLNFIFEDDTYTNYKRNKKINLVNKLIDGIIARKLEYSISIDAGGRKEFIKTRQSIKETKEEDLEEEKDVLDKIAEKIG